MDVKADMKGRPYCYCYPCGVQVFVKSARGVALFEKKYGKDWKTGKQPAPTEADTPPAPKPAPAPAPAAKQKPAKPAPESQPSPEPKRESFLDKPIV
jgi:hypothetical protein